MAGPKHSYADAYQREALIFDDLLDQIRHAMRNYMPAIDDKQCPVNGNHVVDLSCFNDRLTVILHQLEGRN